MVVGRFAFLGAGYVAVHVSECILRGHFCCLVVGRKRGGVYVLLGVGHMCGLPWDSAAVRIDVCVLAPFVIFVALRRIASYTKRSSSSNGLTAYMIRQLLCTHTTCRLHQPDPVASGEHCARRYRAGMSLTNGFRVISPPSHRMLR